MASKCPSPFALAARPMEAMASARVIINQKRIQRERQPALCDGVAPFTRIGLLRCVSSFSKGTNACGH